jgi:hypothetical protein
MEAPPQMGGPRGGLVSIQNPPLPAELRRGPEAEFNRKK